MSPLLLTLLLSQTQPAIRRTTPASDDPGMVVRQAGTVNVNCTSGCSGSSGWLPDGGVIGIVNQGVASDGGVDWPVRAKITDGTLDVTLLNSAPGSDTGQVSMPVRVISSLAGGAGGTSSSYGAAFPASGTASGFSDGTNMQGARVFDTDTGGGTQYTLGVNLRVGASGGSAEAAAGAGTTSTSTLRVVLPTDQTVIPVGDNGSSLTVDGTVAVSSVGGTVTVSGTVDTELPVAATLADATANPSTTSVGSLSLFYNGTTWDRMRGTIASGLLVDVSDAFLLDATFTGRFPTGAALSDNFANPTTTNSAAMNMLWDGATWDRAPGNSTDGMLVNLGTNNDVTVTGTVTANAGTGTFATNVSQVGGNATATGNGTTTTGTQRVTLSSDSTGQVTLATGANTIGALTANQSVNLSQVAGTTTSTGNGTAGAGTQRVTIASDNTAFTVNAAQSGTWTVQPGNTANTTAWLVNAGQVASANNDGSCVSVTATTTVLASNASRRQAAIVARMSNTDTVFVKFGATATTSDFPLEPGQSYNLDGDARVYTGVIDAIANSGTQSVCVTEFN